MMARAKPAHDRSKSSDHVRQNRAQPNAFGMKSSLLVLVLHMLALLPLRVARGIGVLLGDVCWLTRRRMAHTTLINLQLCFPHLAASERKALARQSLRNTFMTAVESGAAWLWPATRTLALIRRVEGLELLQDAHAQGRGVVVLAPHLGNWEIFGLYLNNCGCGQSSQLYQAPDNARLDALIYGARSRAGARMVATDNKGVGELLQALRRGELVGILPDQVPPDSGGEFAPLFGVPALTMTLACRLQQKTGARIVMGFAQRQEGSEPGFTIMFKAPDPDTYAEHMPKALGAMNHSIEALLAAVPEQYQWEYKRFKRQPPGQPRPY
jgi:KDO2-lipid IV(A) lauroyltransferase